MEWTSKSRYYILGMYINILKFWTFFWKQTACLIKSHPMANIGWFCSWDLTMTQAITIQSFQILLRIHHVEYFWLLLGILEAILSLGWKHIAQARSKFRNIFASLENPNLKHFFSRVWLCIQHVCFSLVFQQIQFSFLSFFCWQRMMPGRERP